MADGLYDIQVTTADGIKLTWPATAPAPNQTLVVMPQSIY